MAQRAIRVGVAALAMIASGASAQTSSNQPWKSPSALLILDPYEGNSIDWNELATDTAVKAVIHRAFYGLKPDGKYVARVAEAKRRGLLAGIYLLGRPGDAIAQADALIAAGKQSGVSLLALDIENLDPKRSMTIADAARFLTYVHDKTGRWPLFYTNFDAYSFVSRNYGADSAFGKAPLWLARFKKAHGMNNPSVWSDYTIWQFQSEINCKGTDPCFRRVAGTASDMDVNVFRGTETELRRLFNSTTP